MHCYLHRVKFDELLTSLQSDSLYEMVTPLYRLKLQESKGKYQKF